MDSAKIHLEINAGKCIYDGKTVKPDNRKGKLVLYKICDNLYNFQWINRENNKVEDNLILTKSISLERVEQCKTGRVYLLRNKLRGEVSFYWMQDYDDSKDEVFVKKFNSIIANELSKDIGSKRRYNPNEYSSGLSDLLFAHNRNLQGADSKNAVSFKDFFVSENFSKLLEIPEAYEELKMHMPSGYQNKYDIMDLINSRALNPNLKSLDMSLQSHLNFILMSLNLPSPEGNISDPMEYLVEALENKYKKEENN
ncbi:26S proteasome regulatory subunit RPN13, putative [Plasmodium knowlesi strain H]|uniref:26S proteasome regulatory subunit RPN13, putative n=3 Tax=Plasmodium knowlesi TaxID=5850 RepID=A0A1A7VKX6_PLAKH|nr:26S proteasome regulatory subunit RPN13, putative [Plasmodium knowlesi strain H]OTN67674.1 putative 26S proteasome regulatory subunit RPN13 [Plasmodium knowlesi]CAA9990468.1 26S proteasome regulatory subunit RPN13, putative [Plasmodium knowlesi strain H]SBO19677.1 26S proteasome regulatory subunit RPN13, putative [Plasmodium knowlesi strain H]SBO22495.1 26S proteasome regulatory subunit RPN13, putative [Plasmodium knowlesi strain H]VVS79942.1 26S proteasome regulatory subunit RPN13, putativ